MREDNIIRDDRIRTLEQAQVRDNERWEHLKENMSEMKENISSGFTELKGWLGRLEKKLGS